MKKWIGVRRSEKQDSKSGLNPKLRFIIRSRCLLEKESFERIFHVQEQDSLYTKKCSMVFQNYILLSFSDTCNTQESSSYLLTGNIAHAKQFLRESVEF
jgi:hypothetical protein